MKSRSSGRRTRRLMTGTIAIILLLFATSCARKQTIVRTEYVYLVPPEQYMQTYPEPVLRGPKNGDLLNFAQQLQETCRLYRSDMQALQEWRDEVAK